MAVTFSNRFKLICLWSWYVYSFLLKLFVFVVGKLSFFGVCGTLFFIHFRAGELHVFFVVSGCRCAKGQGTKQGSRGPCTSTAPWSPASYARCQVLTFMSVWLSLCAFRVQESLILDEQTVFCSVDGAVKDYCLWISVRVTCGNIFVEGFLSK